MKLLVQSLVLLSQLMVTLSSVQAQNMDNGKVLYTKCVSCHGRGGEGNKSQKAPMIGGQYDWYLESQIKNIRDKKRVNANTPKMHPFVKDLSDKEIKDLSAYVQTLSWQPQQ